MDLADALSFFNNTLICKCPNVFVSDILVRGNCVEIKFSPTGLVNSDAVDLGFQLSQPTTASQRTRYAS